MGASLAVAAVVLSPLAVIDAPTRMPTAGAVGSVAVLGLLCTAIAFVLMALLIAEIGPSRAVVITYINPIVAVALGVALLGEQPGAAAIAGLLVILAGSWLATDGRLPPGLLRVRSLRRRAAVPPDMCLEEPWSTLRGTPAHLAHVRWQPARRAI